MMVEMVGGQWQVFMGAGLPRWNESRPVVTAQIASKNHQLPEILFQIDRNTFAHIIMAYQTAEATKKPSEMAVEPQLSQWLYLVGWGHFIDTLILGHSFSYSFFWDIFSVWYVMLLENITHDGLSAPFFGCKTCKTKTYLVLRLSPANRGGANKLHQTQFGQAVIGDLHCIMTCRQTKTQLSFYLFVAFFQHN